MNIERNWPLIVTLFGFVALTAISWTVLTGSLQWTVYGTTVGLLLGTKLLLSLLPAKQYLEAPETRTAVVIPMHNEDPAIITRTLASIDA